MAKLPLKLRKEPLIDAVFEMRFDSVMPAASVVPGILFSKLNGSKQIEQLPASDVPKQIRDSDPNLRFSPLVRLFWEDFLILVSDRSVAVGCKMPYPGWSRFQPAIVEIVRHFSNAGVAKSINRYSMKYVDIVECVNIAEQVKAVNLRLDVGGHRLEKENFLIRIEIPTEEFVSVVQVTSSATATLADGSRKSGIAVDIDSIASVSAESMSRFLDCLPERLEKIHLLTKKIFFDCLTQETINSLEPVYD